jgi:hypothetical protein
MTISAEWLQIDNKKVVSSGSGSGEKVSVNGQEFDLVTTDDVSEGSDDDGDDPFAESEAVRTRPKTCLTALNGLLNHTAFIGR